MNWSKTSGPAKRADVLGWDTDLSQELVSPNHKGCDKLLFCFTAFNLHDAQPRVLWEVLASLADRYSTGLVGMTSFVMPLHYMKHNGTAVPVRYGCSYVGGPSLRRDLARGGCLVVEAKGLVSDAYTPDGWVRPTVRLYRNF